MSGKEEKTKKLTVFRTDRHEDFAAMVTTACVVVIVLSYMAFIVPDIKLKAPYDGKIVSVAVAPNADVKKGDTLYTIEYKDKKFVSGQLQENLVQKEIKSKASGKIIKVGASDGQDVHKGKEVLIVLEHEKGTLP